MILTQPSTLRKRLIHVNATWAQRCDQVVYYSSVENNEFPIIKVDIPAEQRKHLTLKLRLAWKYVFDNHFNDADWFFSCDDDTYAIIDNLKYFLSDYNTNKPHYFGHAFKTFGGFTGGGAGYVISKESLRRFGAVGFDSPECRKDGLNSDVAIGACLKTLGVTMGDSVDEKGRSRFHHFTPETHLMGSYPEWYYRYDVHGAKKVKNKTQLNSSNRTHSG